MGGPQTSPVPPDAVSAADYERHARARLDPAIWAYLDGAAADGLTRLANRAAFDDLALSPRLFASMDGAHTGCLLGAEQHDWPVMVAPMASQTLAHPDGECAMAVGARAARTGFTLALQSATPMETVASAAGSGPWWFQLYLHHGRAHAQAMIDRAEAAGATALVVTADAPVAGIRNDEQRVGFVLPDHARPVHLDGAAFPRPQAGPGESPVFKGLLSLAPGWDDLEWLTGRTSLPVWLKGVMTPPDAVRAVEAGVRGVIVSNHGGRVLDTLPASLEALPGIADRLAGTVPVLMDGGIRRGTDIFKALACGADGVLIGRPVLHALAVGGAVGVAHLLTLLRAEFETAMALTGCASISDIGASCLWPDGARG